MVEKVLIYTTPICPHCQKAKRFFEKKQIDYEEINIAASSDKRDEMIEKSGQTGVPVIDIDGQIFVGFKREKIEQALK